MSKLTVYRVCATPLAVLEVVTLVHALLLSLVHGSRPMWQCCTGIVDALAHTHRYVMYLSDDD